MTSAKPGISLGEVNSFLLALQEEQQFADSLRLATTVNAEDEVLESQGFNAEEIRKELQQVSFTDPVSSESVNLLSWMSINCKLDNGSAGISLSAFVNALSSERVRETISQSAELQNFATAMRSLAGGTGSSTGSRSKISIADRIGDAGETKEGDNDGLNELESPREALSSERNGIEPGEMSVNETASTKEGAGRESSRDRMTGQSDDKSEGDASDPLSQAGRDSLESRGGAAQDEDDFQPREAFDTRNIGADRVGMKEFTSRWLNGFGYGDDSFDPSNSDELVGKSVDAGKSADLDYSSRLTDGELKSNVEDNFRGSSKARAMMGQSDDELTQFSGQRGDAAEGSGSSRGSDGGIEMEDMNRDFGQSDVIDMDSRGANIATDDRQGVDNNQASDRGLRSRGDYGDGSREVMSRGTSGVSEDSRLDDSRSSTRSADEGRGSDLDDSGMRDAFSSSAASGAVRDAKISERLNDSLEESGFGSEDSTELRLRNADNITEASYRANQDADSRRYRSTTEDRSDDSADDDLSSRGGELSASDRDIADELMKEAGKPEGFANSADSFDDLKPGEGFTYQSSDGSWKTGIKGQAEDREIDDLGDETQVYKEERNFGNSDKSSELKSSNLSSETDELKTDEENLDELSGSSPTASSGGGDGGDEPKETEPFDTVDV